MALLGLHFLLADFFDPSVNVEKKNLKGSTKIQQNLVVKSQNIKKCSLEGELVFPKGDW